MARPPGEFLTMGKRIYNEPGRIGGAHACLKSKPGCCEQSCLGLQACSCCGRQEKRHRLGLAGLECMSESTSGQPGMPPAGVARPNRAAQVAVSKMATSYQPPQQIDMAHNDAAPLSNGTGGYSAPPPNV